jgi:hypothetical protein
MSDFLKDFNDLSGDTQFTLLFLVIVFWAGIYHTIKIIKRK